MFKISMSPKGHLVLGFWKETERRMDSSKDEFSANCALRRWAWLDVGPLGNDVKRYISLSGSSIMCLFPGCHDVNKFFLLDPSTMSFLPGSQPITD